jgi:hypothetical protein
VRMLMKMRMRKWQWRNEVVMVVEIAVMCLVMVMLPMMHNVEWLIQVDYLVVMLLQVALVLMAVEHMPLTSLLLSTDLVDD